ncbi:Protein-L-isoaspartate(D-aspartate) O-methyltransferase like protein [Aduncisulcus paluster]|uniref:protein-L-isoaspartate(D-aspartate) O-methyltransferase n=1 Tax=Aduncisulcus paluster TaxID=2918883 RepID=A0ABQ5KQ08_9EUKA|nr:Protein-L-isoaspartate(D-aspartate) O-methyltransferase like protein [Aduncisulcus paluster]
MLSQLSMAKSLRRSGHLQNRHVFSAFSDIDRANFVPPSLSPGPSPSSFSSSVYSIQPLPIGHGATISAPNIHALCIDQVSSRHDSLLLSSSSKILDVGSGSGYLSAVFSKLLADLSKNAKPEDSTGYVVALDHIPELIEQSKQNMIRQFHTIPSNIRFVCCDGRKGAPSEYVPSNGFDAIVVGAETEIPVIRVLLSQMNFKGRLIAPVITPHGTSMMLYHKESLPSGTSVEAEIGTTHEDIHAKFRSGKLSVKTMQDKLSTSRAREGVVQIGTQLHDGVISPFRVIQSIGIGVVFIPLTSREAQTSGSRIFSPVF